VIHETYSRQEQEMAVKLLPFQANVINVHLNYLTLDEKQVFTGTRVKCPNYVSSDVAETLANKLLEAGLHRISHVLPIFRTVLKSTSL
jgi:hypothetical protein